MKMFWLKAEVEAAQYVGAINLFGIEYRHAFSSVCEEQKIVVQESIRTSRKNGGTSSLCREFIDMKSFARYNRTEAKVARLLTLIIKS
jgi:hypothetical protein